MPRVWRWRWRSCEPRHASASCFARTAMRRLRQASLHCRAPIVRRTMSPSPRSLRGSPIRGSSTGRRARLLTERLWVRVPPPEFVGRTCREVEAPASVRSFGGVCGCRRVQTDRPRLKKPNTSSTGRKMIGSTQLGCAREWAQPGPAFPFLRGTTGPARRAFYLSRARRGLCNFQLDDRPVNVRLLNTGDPTARAGSPWLQKSHQW